jgi:dihydroorotase
VTRSFDLLLKGGTVVNHEGRTLRDIGIADGRIAALGDLSRASAGRTIECGGLHVLPGVIDTQVHFREPGLTDKEDLESGSRAAVLGGVTAVFEMPNTDPQTVTAEALADKVSRAQGRMHCDFAFWVGGTRENAADVPELERLPAAAGIKVFMGSSTGSLLLEDDAGVADVLRRTRRRAAFHSEDEACFASARACESRETHARIPFGARPRWRSPAPSVSCASRGPKALASTCST